MVDERRKGEGVQRVLAQDALVVLLPLRREVGYGAVRGLGTAGAGAGGPGEGDGLQPLRLQPLRRGRPVWVGLR
eukprot:3685272-Rhodomonas_salina.1